MNYPTIVGRYWRLVAQATSPRPRTNFEIRNLGSSSRQTNNPYLILGIPPSSSFQMVQKAFNKLAFKYHPDTTGLSSVSTDFIKIRQAYERIRNAKEGNTRTMNNEEQDTSSVNKSSSILTESDFLDHFHRQTGVRLTSEQRAEMVHLYRSRMQGGYYGGHSWDLARRLVAEQDAFLSRHSDGTTTTRGSPRRKDGIANQQYERARATTPDDRTSSSTSNSLRRPRKR